MRGAKRVRFKFADFVVEVYSVTGAERRSRKADGAPPLEVDECLSAILKTLAEGRRPSTKLFAAMEARGHHYGEATIRRRLADAVKSGALVSGPDGYSLPEWTDTVE
jgi:hypothetical protein